MQTRPRPQPKPNCTRHGPISSAGCPRGMCCPLHLSDSAATSGWTVLLLVLCVFLQLPGSTAGSTHLPPSVRAAALLLLLLLRVYRQPLTIEARCKHTRHKHVDKHRHLQQQQQPTTPGRHEASQCCGLHWRTPSLLVLSCSDRTSAAAQLLVNTQPTGMRTVLMWRHS